MILDTCQKKIKFNIPKGDLKKCLLLFLKDNWTLKILVLIGLKLETCQQELHLISIKCINEVEKLKSNKMIGWLPGLSFESEEFTVGVR